MSNFHIKYELKTPGEKKLQNYMHIKKNKLNSVDFKY